MMTITPSSTAESPLRRAVARIWHTLRSSRLFIVALAVVSVGGLLALIIPQQPATVNTPGAFVVWVSDLSPLFRQQYELFNNSGLFAIFHSYGFWIPAALLMWMSLLALADLLPATRSRLAASPQQGFPEHPNSSITQGTLRLAAPKDSGRATEALPALQDFTATLRSDGYAVSATDTSVTASRARVGWIWPIALYVGILMVLFGVTLQTIWGDSVVGLVTENGGSTPFIGHTISSMKFVPVASADNTVSQGMIQFQFDNESSESWSIRRWHYRDGWWIMPPQPQPLAKITFSNQNTTEHVTLVFEDISKPLEFSYSPSQTALVVQFAATDGHSDYRIFSRDTDGTQIESAEQTGATFQLPTAGINGKVDLQNRVFLHAVRLPGLIFWVLGVLALVLAASLRLFFTPVIITIAVVVKGRGSRLDVMVEALCAPGGTEKIADKMFTDNSIREESNAQ